MGVSGFLLIWLASFNQTDQIDKRNNPFFAVTALHLSHNHPETAQYRLLQGKIRFALQ